MVISVELFHDKLKQTSSGNTVQRIFIFYEHSNQQQRVIKMNFHLLNFTFVKCEMPRQVAVKPREFML